MNHILLPVPHRRQREWGECMVACAAMAMAYMDIPVSYERLFTVLQIRKQLGVPAYNIRNMEQLGVKVIYKRGTLEELQDQLANNRPCIVFVKTEELPYWNDEHTDHAIVVVGLDSDSVYVNDPRFPEAPIQVSHGDFELAWQERDEYYATLIK